jgi:hypothetical protein
MKLNKVFANVSAHCPPLIAVNFLLLLALNMLIQDTSIPTNVEIKYIIRDVREKRKNTIQNVELVGTLSLRAVYQGVSLFWLCVSRGYLANTVPIAIASTQD